MRLIKFIIISIIGLFVVVTLMASLLSSEVKTSRAVVVHSSYSQIYMQVADLRNWKNWHPSLKADSIIISYSNPSFGKNAWCNIEYKNQQTHLQIISEDSTSIHFLSQLNRINDIDNEISITPVKEEQSFQVEWKAITKLHWYPWEKFYGIFIDRLTGPGYEEALNDLKDYVESEK
ncbi:MAG: hypothetical protein WDM71_00275 [Ferruginibacter sp.]